MQKILNRLFAIALSGLMVILITFNASEAKALTLNNSLIAATPEEVITGAAQNFIKSLLNDYNDNTKDAFDDNIKSVKKTVSNLSALLEKASKGDKSINENKVAQALKESQKQLGNLAQSFDGLADKTEQYDNQLESTLKNLLSLAQGKVRDNLTTNENAFKGISSAISSLLDDTDKAATAKDKDLFSIVGDLAGHVKNLNQAINIADKAIKAFAG